MFEEEEKLVQGEFLKYFGENASNFQKLLAQYELLLRKIKTNSNDYAAYSAAILAATNLKGFVSSYDRLSKGYLGECETILKKILEAFLAAIYFFEHPTQAREWAEGKKIKTIINRRTMAQTLDQIQEKKKIFPTDYEKFFEDYIYDLFYVSSNNIAHLDFVFVHKEIGLESDNNDYTHFFVIGPRFEEYFMKISMNRISMLCLLHLSYMETSFDVKVDDSSIYEKQEI